MRTYILHASPSIIIYKRNSRLREPGAPGWAAAALIRNKHKRLNFDKGKAITHDFVSKEEDRQKKFLQFLKARMKNHQPNELFSVEGIARAWSRASGDPISKESCGRLLDKLGVIARRKRRSEGMFVGLSFN